MGECKKLHVMCGDGTGSCELCEVRATRTNGPPMTPTEYRHHLVTLGLSQQAAGRWLNVSPKTAQNYATKGPSGPASRALMMAVGVMGIQKWASDYTRQRHGDFVMYEDLSAVVGLPGREG